MACISWVYKQNFSFIPLRLMLVRRNSSRKSAISSQQPSFTRSSANVKPFGHWRCCFQTQRTQPKSLKTWSGTDTDSADFSIESSSKIQQCSQQSGVPASHTRRNAKSPKGPGRTKKHRIPGIQGGTSLLLLSIQKTDDGLIVTLPRMHLRLTETGQDLTPDCHGVHFVIDYLPYQFNITIQLSVITYIYSFLSGNLRNWWKFQGG